MKLKIKSNLERKLSMMLVVLLFAVILLPQVFALGIAPGERTFIYASQNIEYNLRIMNDESKSITYDIEVNGDLSQYITLSKNSVSFTPQKTDETISLKFSLPADAKVPPGEYTMRIIVKGEESGNTGVVAFVGVISKLIINVPGDDAYVKASVFVPNFVNGQQNSFSVDITNKGSKSAENCVAVIDVMTALNSKVASVVSEKVSVAGTKTQKIFLPWTPNVNNGNYLAKASVICDGTYSNDEKAFTVGSPDVEIVSFKTDSFKLGQINKFDMILSSEWGENIPSVYADIELTKDGVSVFKTKTESKEIPPLEKIVVPVYLETKGLAPGKYSLYIMLHYMNKDVGEAYNVQMGTDDIIIDKLSGMVTGGRDTTSSSSGGSGGTNGLLILAIIVIVIVNVILVVKILKKKK